MEQGSPILSPLRPKEAGYKTPVSVSLQMRSDTAGGDRRVSAAKCWVRDATTMAFEAPPAEGRQCTSCGDIKILNFFGLDSKECRSCEAIRRQHALKQKADGATED